MEDENAIYPGGNNEYPEHHFTQKIGNGGSAIIGCAGFHDRLVKRKKNHENQHWVERSKHCCIALKQCQ